MDSWVVFGIVVVFIICVVMLVEGLRDRKAQRQRDARIDCHVWTCIRQHGGGNVSTPVEMTEGDAIEWVGENLGPILYVDRECGFIFYRSDPSN